MLYRGRLCRASILAEYGPGWEKKRAKETPPWWGIPTGSPRKTTVVAPSWIAPSWSAQSWSAASWSAARQALPIDFTDRRGRSRSSRSARPLCRAVVRSSPRQRINQSAGPRCGSAAAAVTHLTRCHNPPSPTGFHPEHRQLRPSARCRPSGNANIQGYFLYC